MSFNPIISVVIPCFNEERYIKDCVESLLANGWNPDKMEILIVDGNSSDGTTRILQELTKSYPQVKVLNNPLRITPRSLNMGVHEAKGTFTLISSAHASFEQGYLETLVKEMEKNADTIAVGGVMETKVKNSTPVSESIRTVLMHPVGVGNAKFRTGVRSLQEVDTVPFGLYRSELLKVSGAYNERLIRNHDMELSKRLLRNGGRIYLSPKAKCTYFARETFGAMAKNNFNNGKWNLKTVWITRTFASLSLRHFIPLIFLGAWSLPLLASLVLWNPYGALTSLALLAVYKMVLMTVAWKARNGKNNVLRMVTAFMVLHFAYGLGSFIGLLSLPFTSRN